MSARSGTDVWYLLDLIHFNPERERERERETHFLALSSTFFLRRPDAASPAPLGVMWSWTNTSEDANAVPSLLHLFMPYFGGISRHSG